MLLGTVVYQNDMPITYFNNATQQGFWFCHEIDLMYKGNDLQHNTVMNLVNLFKRTKTHFKKLIALTAVVISTVVTKAFLQRSW